MATPPRSSIFLFLLLPTILAVPSLPEKVFAHSILCPCPYECPPQNETRLILFSHQFPAWKSVPNPNEVNVTNAPGSTVGFGQMYIHDWILAAGLNPNENVVGRLQGFHILAGQFTGSWYTSHIIVFQNGRFAGSTLEVLGLNNPGQLTDELAIMGGTGVFTNAHGNVKFTYSNNSTATDVIREVDIHVFYTPETQRTVQVTAAI